MDIRWLAGIKFDQRRLKMNRTALIQDMMESGVNIVMQEIQSTMASIDSTKNTIQMQHVHGLGKGSIVTTSSNTDKNNKLFKAYTRVHTYGS